MNDDCRTCARYYPGAGCLSEAEMACGCCYVRATAMDRIRLMYKILRCWIWFITGR